VLAAIIGFFSFPWLATSSYYSMYLWYEMAASILLAPALAIVLVDYYFINQCVLDVEDLYLVQGQYWYYHGFNLHAYGAWLISVLLNMPGFLAVTGLLDPTGWTWILSIGQFSGWIGILSSGGVYFVFMRFLADRFLADEFVELAVANSMPRYSDARQISISYPTSSIAKEGFSDSDWSLERKYSSVSRRAGVDDVSIVPDSSSARSHRSMK
jgi:hypothetical protein